MEYKEYELGELLPYEQPTPFIVESTDYNDDYKIPVLTAGKSFILGYTNETDGVYDQVPVIIFDDFTTASQYVNFKFKVKSSAMKILSPVKTLVMPKYIFYRMQIINFDHSTHKRYWIQQYSKIKVRIPPLAEQQRIVNRIEEMFSQLDAGVETLKKTKAQLVVYRQAVVEDAISTSKKCGAVAKKFGEYVALYQNGISKRSGNGTSTPVLRLADIEKQQIITDNEFRCIGLTDNERSRFLLNKGDLLIIRVNGSENNVGRSIVVNKGAHYAACDHFIRCVVDNERLTTGYAQLILDSFASRRYIKENMVSSAGQNTVSQTTMNNITVYVPAINIQNAIMTSVKEKLSVCDSIEQTVYMALQQAEAMRQSILKDAFEGRL